MFNIDRLAKEKKEKFSSFCFLVKFYLLKFAEFTFIFYKSFLKFILSLTVVLNFGRDLPVFQKRCILSQDMSLNFRHYQILIMPVPRKSWKDLLLFPQHEIHVIRNLILLLVILGLVYKGNFSANFVLIYFFYRHLFFFKLMNQLVILGNFVWKLGL